MQYYCGDISVQQLTAKIQGVAHTEPSKFT